MASNGFLQLGTAISGTVVVTPPSGANYLGQPVTFDVFTGGIQLTDVNCVFGPVSGSWGTLTCFGVTEDQGGTIVVVAPGTLIAPFTPLNQQLVVVSPGNISLVVGAQFAAGPVASAPGNQQGSLTSGVVALATGAYTLILASGARSALALQNTSNADVISLVIGAAVQPPSGEAPSAIIQPQGSWPPASLGNFVSTDSIWALCGRAGTSLSYLVG